MEFVEVRDKYKQLREEERKALSSFLSTHKEIQAAGLRVVGGVAGRGKSKYTSGGRIAPFDLSNWKWVEVKDGGKFSCIISLNMPEIDPKTQNIHALYDRVGLVLSPGWVYPNPAIDLPLEGDEKEKIAQLVLKQFRYFQTFSGD